MLAVISYPPIPIWELGPLRLSLHGLFAAVGFLLGAMLATKHVRERGYDSEKFQSILTWGLVGAMLGARYFTSPAAIADGMPLLEALNPIQGNFSIMGGFLGGLIGAVTRTRMLGLKFLPLGDFIAFGLALGTIVGRIGDLAIVEHLGAESDGLLAFGLKPGYEPAPQHTILQAACDASGTPVGEVCASYHHAGLYDMLGAIALIGVLYLLRRYWRSRHYGQLLGFWVVWYGIQRFLIDFTRLVPEGELGAVAADRTLGSWTWSQWSALAAALLGVVLLAVFRRLAPAISEEADREYQRQPVAELEPGSQA